jgi:hypothetical protein
MKWSGFGPRQSFRTKIEIFFNFLVPHASHCNGTADDHDGEQVNCREYFLFFKRMYLSNTNPLTILGCPLNVVFHILCGLGPQDARTPLFLLLQIFNLSIISIALLETCPGRRVTKRKNLFHTNRRSVRDRGSNPCHPQSKQRRKLLSYPLRLCFSLY